MCQPNKFFSCRQLIERPSEAKHCQSMMLPRIELPGLSASSSLSRWWMTRGETLLRSNKQCFKHLYREDTSQGHDFRRSHAYHGLSKQAWHKDSPTAWDASRKGSECRRWEELKCFLLYSSPFSSDSRLLNMLLKTSNKEFPCPPS